MALGRLKLYALLALAFVLGVLGLRFLWVNEGIQKAEAKRNEKRLEAIRKANEVENEVEALDPDTLRKRASKWLR